MRRPASRPVRRLIPSRLAVLALLALSALSSCQAEFPEGTPLNPIRIFFVTSSEVDAVRDASDVIVEKLKAKTGLEFEAVVSSSYQTVIEGMGTGDADLAFMPTNAYVEASERYKCEVALVTVRFGEKFYRAQFIARIDKSIHTLEDVKGMVWGFGDHNSTSGYIIPAMMLRNRGIRVKEEVTTGGHTNTVQQVYEGKVDFGTTYWSPKGADARSRLVTTHPDVFEKVKIVRLTDKIPNDTVTFRAQFDEDMKQTIVAALLELSKDDAETKKALDDMYNINGLAPVEDSFYDNFRKIKKGLPVEVADDGSTTLSSTKGSADDPYLVAAPAFDGLFAHAEINSKRVDPVDGKRIDQLTAKADGEGFARADFAVLDVVDAAKAANAKCQVFAVGETRLGEDHLQSHRQLAIYGRPAKLPKGLFSLADKGLKAGYLATDGVRAEVFMAYARHLELDPELLVELKGEVPADIDVVIGVLPLEGAGSPEGLITYQVSPPFPSHVVVASRRLSPLAFNKLFALVVGEREKSPYPGVTSFSKAGGKALGPWKDWLTPKKEDE